MGRFWAQAGSIGSVLACSFVLQAEKLSVGQFVDVFIILMMAGIWFYMPTDGIALITQWFYNKCMKVSGYILGPCCMY